MSDREIMNAKQGIMPEGYVRPDRFVEAVKSKYQQRSDTGIKKYANVEASEDCN